MILPCCLTSGMLGETSFTSTGRLGNQNGASCGLFGSFVNILAFSIQTVGWLGIKIVTTYIFQLWPNKTPDML